MSKRITSFLVVAVALLLAMPAQAQLAKKRATSPATMVMKSGPIKPEVLKKERAAIMKAKAQQNEGQAFRGNVDAWKMVTVVEQLQEQNVAFEKLMERNLNSPVAYNSIDHRQGTKVNRGIASRNVNFNTASAPSRRASNRAEVVDAHGMITSPAEGESKFYTRSGFGYYVQNQQLYYAEQEGNTEIVETTDGVVYIKNFISNVASGIWVKGTKSGNTITIPAGQVITYNTTYDYGLYIAKCTYVEGTGWSEVDGDITLTVDGNTISLDGTDADNPVACFWTDDFTFSGYGDYETVFTYDPTYVAPELIELPEGATVETWYQEQTVASNTGDNDGFTKVAFVGNEVYLSGIFASFPDSWIKGTIDGTTVTFSGLQFVGEYEGYNIFAVGTDGEVLVDFQMTYDAAAQKLTAVNDLLANAKEDAIYYLEWYKNIVITKDAPAEPEATTGANVDALPYSNALNTADLFAEFGVIDSNKDGSTWAFDASYGAYYRWNSSNNANDWLISPAIKLEAGKKYHFAIDAACALASYPEKFEVKIGTEPKASALTQSVLAETEVTNTEYVTYENELVTVTETGYYHFGIHATSDADQFRLMVQNFLVEAGAEAGAPAAVSDLALSQTEGKLEVNVSFTAPTKTVNGADLTSLTKIDILRNGQVIKSLTGGGSSSDGQISWVAADQGYENAQDIASINFGSGFTATLDGGGNSNTPKYYTSGTALRMYGDNTMTISGAGITKITFTLTGNENQTQLEANVGNYALEGTTGTWTGEADAVTFIVPSGKQARIQKIEIEGTVVEGLTPGAAITYVDDDENLAVGTYTYQVIPYNEAGAGAKSEEKSIFLSVALEAPYTFDFSQNLLEQFAVIDNNADGKTWIWSSANGAYYPYSGSNAADDYLITLPFNLKAGKTYNVIVNAKGSSSYPERMEVVAGQEATVAALTQKVINPVDVNLGEFADYEGTFAPAEDGQYYFAIHAISDADMLNLCVSTLTIELAPEPTAPAAIADFTAEPGAEGALEANLAFTAPAKAIDGSALSGTVDVKIYRDNELVNTLTGIAVGSAQTWKDTDVESGNTYTYYLVAANESGDGMKSEKASVFVGEDEFAAVENINITGITANTISLSWDPVTGVNGGYVNAATAKYAVVSTHVETVLFWQILVVDEVLVTVTGETSATFNYDDVNAGEQEYKYFGVLAFKEDTELPAAGDEYDGGYTSLLVGAPDELPVQESFTDQMIHYNWESNGGLGVDNNSSDEDGVALKLYNDGTSSEVFFVLPKVNLSSAANPTIIFDAFNGVNVDKVKVIGSADGADYTELGEFNLTSDYASIKQTLTSIKGTAFSSVGILATIPTASVSQYEDYVVIDNIRIVDLYEYNLKAEIKAPASVVAGQKAKVVATITNEGENPAQDYTVTIKAGENVLTTVLGSDALAPFAKDEIEVDFEPSIFGESGDVTLTVTVDYDNELYPDDNTATAIITVKDPTVPAPAGLTATDNGVDGVDLVWSMPAEARAAAAETEDFDDQASFPEFDLGGITADEHNGALADWTLYDGNGITTYGFNGITFPNSYQPMAFIPFNPSSSQLSADLSANYAPHSGSQFMMSFCPVDENGNAPATDHWMISPSLSGDAQTISFYARAITDQYGAETFEILASSTDNQPSSFTVVSSESTAATDWVEFTADLPAGTKYFAIRHTSTDVFGLMIDDVTFAAGEGAPLVPVNYNVYYEQGKLATVNADVTTYTAKADQIGVGEHVFSVTAVYAGGVESKPISATVDVITNINQIAVNGQPVDVYTLDGKLVRSQVTSLAGLKGLYIINGKKVMIK